MAELLAFAADRAQHVEFLIKPAIAEGRVVISDRYADAKARKNYSGMSPITRTSGKSHVVLARYARNRRLADACYLWAFAAITASPGAREFYDQRRAAGDTHHHSHADAAESPDGDTNKHADGDADEYTDGDSYTGTGDSCAVLGSFVHQ